MKCLRPYVKTISKGREFSDPDKVLHLPCGKCISCRVNRAEEWTTRLTNENLYSESSYFVTLTYDDEHLPFDENGNPCVSKDDIQKFLKRIRKNFPKSNIRYWITSEYGPETLRPHYHGIFFNLPDDVLFSSCNSSKIRTKHDAKGNTIYIGNRFTQIWSKGATEMTNVTRSDVSYCSKYFVNKLSVPEFLVPCFCLMSRRPGIGYVHIENIKDKVRFYNLRTLLDEKGHSKLLPRYYKNKIYTEEERKELFEKYVEEIKYDKKYLDMIQSPEVFEDSRNSILKFNKPNSKLL